MLFYVYYYKMLEGLIFRFCKVQKTLKISKKDWKSEVIRPVVYCFDKKSKKD